MAESQLPLWVVIYYDEDVNPDDRSQYRVYGPFISSDFAQNWADANKRWGSDWREISEVLPPKVVQGSV